MTTYKASLTTTGYVQVGNAFQQVSLQVQNDTVQLSFATFQPGVNERGFMNLTPQNPNIEWLFPDKPLWAKPNSDESSLYVTVAEDPLLVVKPDPNNTSVALPTTGSPYQGTWTKDNRYDGVTVTMLSDTAGTGYIDFFDDNSTPTAGSTPRHTQTWNYESGTNEFNQYIKAGQWYRLRYVPTTNPSTFQINAYLTKKAVALGTYALNGVTLKNDEAVLIKSTDPELLIASDQFSGQVIASKYGFNPDIDVASVPEDIWDGSGVYTGFPTGAPEAVTVASNSGSDTGSVTFHGLRTNASTVYTSETVAVGATSVNTWYRVHSATYNNSNATSFNVGTITLAHATTTANVFQVIRPGHNQSNAMVYTVPAGSTGYIRGITASIMAASSGRWVTGALWARKFGESPRLLRPFTLSPESRLNISPFGGIVLQPLEDITCRVDSVSNNDTGVAFGMDILTVVT